MVDQTTQGRMSKSSDDRVGPMLNPPHLGQLIREGLDEVGWETTVLARRLHCTHETLSHLLNGEAGLSEAMAKELEAMGWGTAKHWMRMQASYDLAQARRQSEHEGV